MAVVRILPVPLVASGAARTLLVLSAALGVVRTLLAPLAALGAVPTLPDLLVDQAGGMVVDFFVERS